MADLAHALGVKFMVGGIQLFIVTIAAGVPVLRSVSLPGGGGYVANRKMLADLAVNDAAAFTALADAAKAKLGK